MIFINHKEVLDGKAAIVEIKGELNGETSPDFEDYINKLLKKNIYYILLDAQEIKFLSSEGIGVNLLIQKKLDKKNGFLIINNPPEEVLSLFKILGFDKIFTLTNSRIEALQIMDRQMEMRDDEKTDKNDTSEESTSETHKEDSDFEPFIVECHKCGSLIRVKNSGEFLCPDCETHFKVLPDKTVTFISETEEDSETNSSVDEK